MTDQTKIAQLADNVAGDEVRTGAIRSFAQGGPTDAQKEAGNYRKLHTSVHGMKIAIETEKGSERTGTGKNGKTWSVQMPAHYGYVKGTEGKDGDHVDVYLGPAIGHPVVHVVDQVDHESGRFDEHKAMVGFRSRKHALDTYHQSFSDGHGPDRVGSVTSLPVGKFKDWLAKGKRTAPLGKLKVRSFAEGGATDDDTGFLSEDDLAQSPQAVQEAGGEVTDDDIMRAIGGGHGGGDVTDDDILRAIGGRPEYSEGKQFAIRAAKSVAPGLAGLGPVGIGAGAGAMVAGPPGAVVGGLGGAVVSALTVSPAVRKFQEWLLDKLGVNANPEEEAAYAQEHPYRAAAADILGGMAGMNPTQQGVGLGGRAVMGAVQGGFEAASQKLHGQDMDPTTIAMAVAAGAAFPGLNRAGRKVYGAGEHIGTTLAEGAGYKASPGAGARAGRPDLDPEVAEGDARTFEGWDQGNPINPAIDYRELEGLETPGGEMPGSINASRGTRGVYPQPAPIGRSRVRDYDPRAFEGINQGGPMRPHPDINEVPDIEGDFAVPPNAMEQTNDSYPPGTAPPPPQPVGPSARPEATPGKLANENLAGQTRPGTSPPDNTALPTTDSTFGPYAKTAEFIRRSKAHATPTAGSPGVDATLGTAHEMARPRQDVGDTVGSNPDHPLSVGSERDYRATADGNVHPSSSGGPSRPTAETLDPTQGSIPSDQMAALNPDKPVPPAGQGVVERSNGVRPGIADPRAGAEPTPPAEVTAPATGEQSSLTPGKTQAQLRQEYEEQAAKYNHRPTIEDYLLTPEEQQAIAEAHPNSRLRQMQLEGRSEEEQLSPKEPSSLSSEGPKILEDMSHPGFNAAMVDEAKMNAAKRKWERGNQTDDAKLMDEAIQEMKDAIGAGKSREQKEAEAEAERRKGLQKKAEQEVIQPVSPEQAVTGATKRDTDLKVRAAQASNSALEKFRPTGDEVIGLGEGPIKALQERLWSAIEHATEENAGVNPNYTRSRKALAEEQEATENKRGTQEAEFNAETGEFAPAKSTNLRNFSKNDTPAQTWLLAAQKLVGTREAPRKFSPKQMMEFMTDERALAQNTKAAAQDVKDLRRINNDLQAGRSSGSQEVKNRDMVDDWLQSQPKEVREQWLRDHLSPVSEEDINHLNDTARAADDMAKTQHEQDLEDRMTREVEIPQHEKDAQAVREKIEKARAEGAGRAGEDYKPGSPWAGPIQIAKDLISDTSGRFDPRKAIQLLTSQRALLHDWWVNQMMPEMRSTAARYAGPLIAKGNAVYAASKARILETLWHAEKRMFDRLSPDEAIEFMDRVEKGMSHPQAWMNVLADDMRRRLDLAAQEEKMYGSPAEYRENYLPHLFADQAAFKAFVTKYAQQFGPTWFERERTYAFIKAALKDGLKLKYDNPVQMVQHRLIAGENMKRIMHTLLDLSSMRQAFPVDAAPASAVRGEWQEIIAPNRQKWLLSPDVQPLWKNAMDTTDSLWNNPDLLGKSYRGWMAYKGVWAPITLGLSFFHQLHIAAGVVQADNFTRGFKYTQGSLLDKLKGGAMETARNWSDPLFSNDKQFYWFGRKVAPDYIGKQVRNSLMVDPAERTPLQDHMHQLVTEAGLNLAPAEQEWHDWSKRFQTYMDKQEYIKAAGAGVMKMMQDVQKPAFLHMIPNLKAASLFRTAEAYFKAHPEEWNDKFQRTLALRTIGKEIEDRYGEMFYNNLFTNRMAKEIGIGSMLSLSWNLGFARHLTGGVAQMGEEALRAIPGMNDRLGVRSGASRVAYQANSKAAYVLSYTGMAMGMAGLMSYGLSGQAPTDPLDYAFPRVGGTNPDGSPRRISTMFFTREPVQVKGHAEGHGPGLSGLPGGLGEVLYNKMIIAPLVEAFKNRDFYGRELYDPSAPWLKQWGQLLMSTVKNHFNPIAVQGGEKAAQTGGGFRDKYVLPALGLTPAPTYIERQPIQNRIAHLFREGPGATPKPYGNRDRDLERGDARAALAVARQKGDSQAASEAMKRLLNTGLSAQSVSKDVYGTQDVYQFKQLDLGTKQNLLKEMKPEDYQRYVLKAGPSKDLPALIKEWNRLHK